MYEELEEKTSLEKVVVSVIYEQVQIFVEVGCIGGLIVGLTTGKIEFFTAFLCL